LKLNDKVEKFCVSIWLPRRKKLKLKNGMRENASKAIPETILYCGGFFTMAPGSGGPGRNLCAVIAA